MTNYSFCFSIEWEVILKVANFTKEAFVTQEGVERETNYLQIE